jgi:hypothetical protein
VLCVRPILVARPPGALLDELDAGPLTTVCLVQFEIDDRSAEQVRLIGLPQRSSLIGQCLEHRQRT